MDTTEFLKKFGKKIKIERIKKDYSQEQLAEYIDSNQTYISSIENGAKNVTLDTVLKLSEALKVDVHKLFLFNED